MIDRATGRAIAIIIVASALRSPVARAEDPPKAPLAQRVREAAAKGSRALAQHNDAPDDSKKDDSKVPHPRVPLRLARNGQGRPLIALALLRAGGDKERVVARHLIDAWWKDATATPPAVGPITYELSLEISALEALSLTRVEASGGDTTTRFASHPVEPEILKRLEAATAALLDQHSEMSADEWAWSYGTPPLDLTTRTTREKPRTGEAPRRPHGGAFDNSNTQFAVLALHDAARAGVKIPAAAVHAIATHFAVDAVDLDGRLRAPGEPVPTGPHRVRWGYRQGDVTQSMTFAGLSSLAIARELGAEKLDDLVAGGLAGIGEYVWPLAGDRTTGRTIGGAGYTYYALEKAFDLLEIKQIEGRDWYAPLAEHILAAQQPDGLWGDDVESSFFLLFLMRGTISKSRIVSSRCAGGDGDSRGQVYLATTQSFVDAIALIEAYGRHPSDNNICAAREALHALLKEGHGRAATLIPPLASLSTQGGRAADQAISWLREIVGHPLSRDEIAAAAERATALDQAKADREAKPLLAALGEENLLLPLRAYAANALATLPCPEAAPEIASAAEKLARDEKGLGSVAGDLCARALADALTALGRVPLPELDPKKPVTADALRGVARAYHEGKVHELEARVARGLDSYERREYDAAGWTAMRTELDALGKPALERLVAIARDKTRTASACSLLRTLTGELIPDDLEAWNVYIGGK